jgi:hypothetical protein
MEESGHLLWLYGRALRAYGEAIEPEPEVGW